MNQLDFKKRAAIVTGGAQGIGLAIAKRLVASGAKVRIWDRDEKLLTGSVASLGASASGEAVDVTDRAAVERATIGRIDVLVNNAGIAGPTVPVVDYPVEDWQRVIDIDLTGPFLCCRAVVPHMTKAGYGRIVNFASIAGKEGNPNAAAYAAAKGGLTSLTMHIACQYGPQGIRCNAVAPGVTLTPMVAQRLEDERFRKINTEMTPHQRLGKIDDIASTVAFLCSEGAGFINGQTIVVDGGWSSTKYLSDFALNSEWVARR